MVKKIGQAGRALQARAQPWQLVMFRIMQKSLDTSALQTVAARGPSSRGGGSALWRRILNSH